VNPLSSIIANLVLRDIENRAINTINISLPFYVRYVDDIVLSTPSDSIQDIANTFNSFYPRLQFTLEIGEDRLNFLDVIIMKTTRRLEFDWFHKPFFFDRYLHYHSQHALVKKKGTSMVDRAFILSHPKYHQKNWNSIVKILYMNDYPLSLFLTRLTQD